MARLVPLRWHLVGIVVGILLPVLALTGVLAVRLRAHERAIAERRLVHRARTLADALDREMAGTLRTLDALAASQLLDDELDVARVHAAARRVLDTQPSWTAVILSSSTGEPLVDTRFPSDAPVPRLAEDATLHAAVAVRARAIGDLARGPEGHWAFASSVPVIRGGRLRYMVVAITTPSAIARVLEGGGDSGDDWARGVTDRQGIIVARTRAPERFQGMPQTREFLAKTADLEGIFPSVTLDDGAPSYVAYRRAATSSWVVSVAVPRAVIDGPLKRTLVSIVLLGGALLLLTGGGAFLVGRRLSRDFAFAAAGADDLAHGRVPELPPSTVTEIARLRESLSGSAMLLQARDVERAELVARAEAARAQAELASRSKDEFLAMLGHELRNPLAPIVTVLRLREMRGEPVTHEHTVLQRQVRHLVRLVDDLLDVSRITRGKLELKPEPVEVATFAARAVEMASPLYEEKGHALTMEVPDAGLVVRGDVDRLTQMLANLLTNAAKYTPPRGHVRLTARRVGEDVEIVVADDGQGISETLLPRVFDLFVQGARSADRQEGGLGIGLTLVKSLASAHRGTVEARSDGLGKGSTFLVRLPASSAPASVHARVASRIAHAPVRLLVVDDNVDAAELLMELLASEGHEVKAAHDPAAALAVVDTFVPQVAILDIGLPVMDGYELAERLREKLGDAAPTFIALTGYGQSHDRARSRAARFHAHLVKPPEADALLAVIDEIARAR